MLPEALFTHRADEGSKLTYLSIDSICHRDLSAARRSSRQLIQIGESMACRAICTREFTYCVADLAGDTTHPASATHHEYQFYGQSADPSELINLAGRQEYRASAKRNFVSS